MPRSMGLLTTVLSARWTGTAFSGPAVFTVTRPGPHARVSPFVVADLLIMMGER
jgi:hypothetical protein